MEARLLCVLNKPYGIDLQIEAAGMQRLLQLNGFVSAFGTLLR
jgi:hypothetical protein